METLKESKRLDHIESTIQNLMDHAHEMSERIDDLEEKLEAYGKSQEKSMLLLHSECDHIRWNIQRFVDNGQIIRANGMHNHGNP